MANTRWLNLILKKGSLPWWRFRARRKIQTYLDEVAAEVQKEMDSFGVPDITTWDHLPTRTWRIMERTK